MTLYVSPVGKVVSLTPAGEVTTNELAKRNNHTDIPGLRSSACTADPLGYTARSITISTSSRRASNEWEGLRWLYR